MLNCVNNRNLGTKINAIWNQWLPPFIRDSNWFMYVPMKIVFKKKAKTVMRFREQIYDMTDEDYQQAYIDTAPYNLCHTTDLNDSCIDHIKKNIFGKKILEAGCGRGYLLSILNKEQPSLNLTGTDIMTTNEMQKVMQSTNIHFKEAFIEKLPYQDDYFDTTICTHVLEHVRDIHTAIKELRRVTSKRLIVVVPKERPYKFGFNLHLTFFPYKYSVLDIFRPKHSFECYLADGDWFYMETFDTK